MKTKKILMTFLIGTALTSAFANKKGVLHQDEFKVDTKLSSMEWVGKKVTGQHNGTISLSSGEVKVEHGTLVGGTFEINMTTLANSDLQGEYKGKLETHLKSDDFFGVEKHPKAKFEITSVTPIQGSK